MFAEGIEGLKEEINGSHRLEQEGRGLNSCL